MNLFLEMFFEVGIVYTVTQTVAESKLTSPIRGWLETSIQKTPFKIFKLVGSFIYTLISCFMCTGVWVSFLISSKFFNLAQYLGYMELSVFWNGLFLAFLVWFLRCVEEKLTH